MAAAVPLSSIFYAAPVSPRTARAVALPFSLLAFLIEALLSLWITPLDNAFVPLAVGLALPMAGYFLLIRRAGPRPAGFEADDRARLFVGPAAPWQTGLTVVMFGWLAGNTLFALRAPHLADRFTVGVAVFMVLFAFVGGPIMALRRTPCIELSPEGLTARRPFGRHLRLPWDQLAPGGPPPPAAGESGSRILVYTRVAGSFRPRNLWTREYFVDPAFLAHAIRTYVHEPASRAAVGTAPELARLQASFRSPAA
jgi:hypothetical protein